MIRTPARVAQLQRTRNRLNDLGDRVRGVAYNIWGDELGTDFEYSQGSARNAKRIRARNRINAILRMAKN
jgi:hypothetical protein